MRFIQKLLIKSFLNGYKLVYVDYSLRLIGQFVIFSVLIKSVLKIEFADYAFFIMVSGYVGVVINASLDALINDELTKKQLNDFYIQSLKLKLVLYILFSVIVTKILDINLNKYLIYGVLGCCAIILEHLDVKMRFLDDYSSIKYRILTYPLTMVSKLYCAWNGYINELIILSIIECVFFIIMSGKCININITIGGELSFIKQHYTRLMNVSLSGFLIFTFLQLDQFFVYKFLGKESYAGYALVYKFFAIANALLGIYSRYLIPKLYLEEISYWQVLKDLWLKNLLIIIVGNIVFYLYLHFWIKDYLYNFLALMVLSLGGFALLFGQVRGVFFVKADDLIPDIFNAMIGILAFLVVFFSYKNSSIYDVAICFCFGSVVSGFLTTFLYKRGWLYCINLLNIR